LIAANIYNYQSRCYKLAIDQKSKNEKSYEYLVKNKHMEFAKEKIFVLMDKQSEKICSIGTNFQVVCCVQRNFIVI
jgi:hypothetical protein